MDGKFNSPNTGQNVSLILIHPEIETPFLLSFVPAVLIPSVKVSVENINILQEASFKKSIFPVYEWTFW